MLPLTKRKTKSKKSWISNHIKNSSSESCKLLKVYQIQGNFKAKQNLRQQTDKVKKMESGNKKDFYNGLLFENAEQHN